jgi:TRAP-type mannitol/chloroaromatic compound transport system permease large subunit
MALILQKSRVVEDIYDSFLQVVRPSQRGIAVATILVVRSWGSLRCSGSGVIGLGLIGLPQMLKYATIRE